MRLRGRPWRAASYAVVDLELTGLDPRADEIVSWCLVPVEGGAIRIADIRADLVRPARATGDRAVRIHGLRDGDLAAATAGDAALLPLLDALEGRVLVAHAARVEREFLAPVLARAGRRPIRRWVDTAQLWARVRPDAVRPGRDVVGLTEIAQALGLPVHAPHTAEGDALTTAQVFLALAARLDAERPQTVRSLTGKHAGGARGIRRPLP